MTKIFLALSILVSLTAQAQVLGELKGEGQLHATYAGFDGSSTERNSSCSVAMNIRNDNSSFALEFSYFECPKLTIWNDGSYAYRIAGDKLINAAGVQKGSVLADGSFQFTEDSVSTQTYQGTEYDFTCRLLATGTKTLNLKSSTTYNFKKLADNSWQVRRQASEDRMAWTSKRFYPNCPAVTIPTKLGSTSDLSVIVK